MVWLGIVAAAALWGCTNPLMKSGASGVSSPARGARTSIVSDAVYLLSHATLVGPATNALTFAFTAAAAHMLSERPPSPRVVAGVVLILGGVTLCTVTKQQGAPVPAG
eukprot:m51a1_g5068 hypothetical protein (108) ;mRNA; r:143790-144380